MPNLGFLWRLVRPIVRRYPFILIALIVVGAVASLSVKQIDLPVPGGRFERGSNDVLGLQLGVDLAGGAHLIYEAGDAATPPTADQMEGLIRIIRTRVDRLGASEPVIQKLGDNRVVVQLPGLHDVARAKQLLGQTASLAWAERICLDRFCTQFEDNATGLSGDDLASAFAGQDTVTGENVLFFELRGGSARTFAELTTRLYTTRDTDSPDQLTIFLDDVELVSAVVNSPILSGNGQVTGGNPPFTAEEARDLAIQLESGRLPIDIRIISEQVVGPSLGAKSLEQSLVAGIVGLALVLFFMIAYYRGAGVVAAVTMIFYTAMVLAVFKLVPLTLILAGVAGFILSMGMAVDANILIFERMKEELRLGRTLAFAIRIGFNRAWPSIRDSNISTMIISGILYWFGTTFAAAAVTGFALALLIGVAISMFTAIVVSRGLLVMVAATPLRRFLWLFSPEPLPRRGRDAGRTARSASERGPS